MKEYIGKVVKINVDEYDLNNINFLVNVKDEIISINLHSDINTLNIYVNDEVLVEEDIVMGKKVYNIKHPGDIYG